MQTLIHEEIYKSSYKMVICHDSRTYFTWRKANTNVRPQKNYIS